MPAYKIEIYQNGSPTYTITEDAKTVRVKEFLTSNVGTFTVTVPFKKGSRYLYNDVNVNDTVKIWMGRDSIPSGTDPLARGRICQIASPFSRETGFRKSFIGRTQGEILKRRVCRKQRWANTDASVIVNSIASTLGLGTSEIETDTTDETIVIDTAEPYFDVLRKVSDYWYSGAVQVKKDFYVDVNNNLVWKSRPLRTTGVESFEYGKNIKSYLVLRDVLCSKNKIYQFGAAEKANPSDKDSWTDSTSGWTVDAGTIGTDTDRVVGDYSLKLNSATSSPYKCTIYRTFSSIDCSPVVLGFRDSFKELRFFSHKISVEFSSFTVRIYAPDFDNAFYQSSDLRGVMGEVDKWSGEAVLPFTYLPYWPRWTTVGSPDWSDVRGILVTVTWANQQSMFLDGLHFFKRPFSATADASASVVREVEYTDNRLMSDSECEKRAKSLLYQQENPVTRLDVTVLGNTNVKIGDQCPVTIPAENMDETNFDVISVEHVISVPGGFLTKAITVNVAETRTPPPAQAREVLLRELTKQREIGRGIIIGGE